MNTPYTHPSMPGTSYRDYLTEDPRPQYQKSIVAIDLTVDVHPAALEDAEGHALVEAIHRRKREAGILDNTTTIPGGTHGSND